jgi:hypothetical protein
MQQKLFLIFSMLICVVNTFAQSNWSLRGNSVNDTDFVGTTNAKNLLFKANNLSSFKVKTNGRVNFMYSAKIDSILDVDSIHARVIRVGNSSLVLGGVGSGSGTDEISSTFGVLSFGSSATSGSYTAFSDINFNIGFNSITTYDPNRSRLNVNGGASIGNTNTGILAPTNGLIVEGRTGVGASAPARKMEVYESSAAPQFRISSVLAPNPLQYTDFETTSSGNLRINPSNSRSGFNLSGTEPQNTVEIRQGVNGNSGLRLTNLRNIDPSITNTTDKILSVNSSGDVILVDDKQGPGGGGVNYCGGVTNDFLMKRETSGNLCMSGVYEVPSGGNINNIGIGSSTPANLTSKLNISGNTKIGSGYVGTTNNAPANGMVIEGRVGIGRNNGTGRTVNSLLHLSAENITSETDFFLISTPDRPASNENAFRMYTTQYINNSGTPNGIFYGTSIFRVNGYSGGAYIESAAGSGVSQVGVRMTNNVNGWNKPGIEIINGSNANESILSFGADTVAPNPTTVNGCTNIGGPRLGARQRPWGRVYVQHEIQQPSQGTGTAIPLRIRPGMSRDDNNNHCASFLQTNIFEHTSYFRVVGIPNTFDVCNTLLINTSSGIDVQFDIGGNHTVGIGMIANRTGTALQINGGTTATAAYTFSDNRLKKNINDFSKGLDVVRQLNIKSFQYNGKYGLRDTNEIKVGVMAQDIQQLIPEAVSSFMGRLNNPQDTTEALQEIYQVNYNSVLFTAINAIKELDSKNQELENKNQQQAQAMEQQAQKIEEIMQRLEQCCKAGADGNRSGQLPINESENNLEINSLKVELSNANRIVLNQNEPNPFKEKTIIRYTIPTDVKQAEIIFFDQKGSIIKSVLIETRGLGQLEVFSSNLSAGTYSYSLVADGISIDTKKMVNVK